MPVGEFLTKNSVLMLRKIPSIRFYSPSVREPSRRREIPCATPAAVGCHLKGGGGFAHPCNCEIICSCGKNNGVLEGGIEAPSHEGSQEDIDFIT